MRHTPASPGPSHRLLAATAAFAIVFVCPTIVPAGEPALDDQAAAREYQAAQPDIELMQKVLVAEVERIFFESKNPQSPAVAKLMNPATVVKDIGDAHLPLHLRIIEQWRRDYFVAGVQVAQEAASGHCEDLVPRPDQLLNPALRAKGFQNIQCERDKMERFQVGMHRLGRLHEANISTLRLPGATQAKKLAEIRASTAQQDKQLESMFAKRRESLHLSEETLKFIDAHAARMHLVDGKVVFDDPADFKASQELGERLKSDSEILQSQ
jgi:hypothetical protein